jgi:hypothetical protein
MNWLVEIFERKRGWVVAPVFFESRAEAEDYCEARADRLTRVVRNAAESRKAESAARFDSASRVSEDALRWA